MGTRTRISTVLSAAAVAAAVVLAPAAQAAPSGPVCSTTSTSSLCQSDGNAQVVANPPAVDYQSQYPFFGGYALLFHHSGNRG